MTGPAPECRRQKIERATVGHRAPFSKCAVRSLSVNDNVPEGTLAYREYELQAPGGTLASAAFTLSDLSVDNVASEFAKRIDAVAFGLISVMGWPGGPRMPIVWVQLSTRVGLCPMDFDDVIPSDLQPVLARLIAIFFCDIAVEAEELAGLKLTPVKPTNKTVH